MTPTQFAHWLCDQLQDDLEAFDVYQPVLTVLYPAARIAVLTSEHERFEVTIRKLPPKRKGEP